MADLTSNDRRGIWATPADAPRIVGVNGINTHGENNIDILLAHMEKRGFETVDVKLPKRHALSARWGGRPDGRKVAYHSRDGDILVAHSFGAVRAWYAHQYREYRAIFIIAGAHSRNADWRVPGRVWCYYSPDDTVIKIGASLICHPFGKAGVKGYRHPAVRNIKVHSDHDDYFHDEAILFDICNRIELAARYL